MRKSVLILLCLLLFSCTTAGIRKSVSGPTNNLKDTVTMYYELKKEGRVAEAWNFERMSQDGDAERREKNRKVYLGKSGMGTPVTDYKILGIGKEGSGTEGFTPVKIKVVTDWPALPFPSPDGKRPLDFEDLWEKIDGKWYHVIRGVTKFW